MTQKRSIGFWILGSICVFFGAMIAGSVEGGDPTTAIAYIISFILILIGGMFWIAVPTLHLPE